MDLSNDYGGVYCIINNINNKLYVGSSVHINRRFYTHIQALNGKYHGNTHLQNAWDKYGAENFSFKILEVVNGSEKEIRERKQYWIDYYKSYEYDLGYNISHYAIGGGGYEVSEATRQKLSDSHKGKTHSEETKKKMSENRQGEKNPSYGKHHTEETKIKMKQSHQGENSPNAKLTEKDVIDILRMLCEYTSSAEICNKYNITESTLSNIKNKQRWGYLYEKFPELYSFPNLPQRHKITQKNKSGVIGVRFNSKRNKWVSSLIYNGKYYFLGHFNDKDSAVKARLLAEIKYFGKLAPQRHLFEQYNIDIGGILDELP